MGIHIGKILEKIVRMERIGISELSRKLKVSRRTIYNWFEQENLNLQILFDVGEIIGHDFTNDLPESMLHRIRRLPSTEAPVLTNEDELASTSVYFWMNKYVSLLEKYNHLLSKVSDSPTTPSIKRKNPQY